jgi:intracellular sulfur oxidation DsrE/DsrF family protein
MSMQRWFAWFAAVLGAMVLATGSAWAEGKQKVVYHINGDNPKQQQGALRNIQNHINAIGADKLDLKVVLHGNGLSLLLDPASLSEVKGFKNANATEVMNAAVDSLRGQGVQFQVCENTLRSRNVKADRDLYLVSEGDIVPSGVAQLAILQGQGYAYIKP